MQYVNTKTSVKIVHAFHYLGYSFKTFKLFIQYMYTKSDIEIEINTKYVLVFMAE